MPPASRPLLKRQDVRRGAKAKCLSNIAIKKQDAIKFLSELKPGSVDLIVSSPPYCIGKAYESTSSVSDFESLHERLAPLLFRALRNGGSVCWQIGHHVQNNVVTPLDAIVYGIFSKQSSLVLRNRVVWTFAHGVHASKRLSGRHETVLWFTKGENYTFNLDAIRIPQKYPGKRHYKGPNKGQFSGNPLGKNPSDVWEIPNVKANHIEKTNHPCQFPIALVQRLIRGLSSPGELIVDPFLGSGTSAIAAILEKRAFAGCDVKQEYVRIAQERVSLARLGTLPYRRLEQPIYKPSEGDAVARRPSHFRDH